MKMLFVISMLFWSTYVFAQDINVNVHIFEEDTQEITPVMVCITSYDDSVVVIPPNGEPAGAATFPAPFYEGIAYSAHRNWVGPIRKTMGKGGVNKERTYVYGTNPTLPYWNEPVMYQVSGEFSIKLKPGKYRISIEHGNEYIPVTEEFTLVPNDTYINKSYLLKRWINLPQRGWYSGDVHAHHALNKPVYREYMLQMARAEDVHLVNMLEMGDRQNTYFKSPSFGKNSSVCKRNYCLVFGQEEPRSDYGHIIGLNIDALARDTAHYNEYDRVFDTIHKSDEALVGFAHFAYKGEGVTEGMALYAPLSKVDFVELMQNTQINQQDYYDYLNLGFRIAAAAGSDFPWGSTIGDCRTFVYTGNSFSPADWFKGLKAGRTFVSNGPALFLEVNKNMPGEEIRCAKNESVHIKATALSKKEIGTIKKIEIYNNNGLIYSKENRSAADSLSFEINHNITKSQWICAAVFCENIALAHTSPVYVIANGQPIFDSEKGRELRAKQLRLLKKITERENAKKTPDTGILERVKTAEIYYRKTR